MLMFILASLMIAILPGPDFALVTRQTLVRGKGSGFMTTLGCTSGLSIHLSAGAFGPAALVMASPVAFTTLKVVGAVYLSWLGVQTIRMARRAVKEQPTGEPSARNPWRCWRKGFLSTVLNIKLAMFILTFLPQFLPSEVRLTQALTYSGVFALVYAAWLITYVFTIDKLGMVLRRRRVRSGIEYVTAVILLGFGVNLVIQGIA